MNIQHIVKRLTYNTVLDGLYLYGSQATGHTHSTSDIDLGLLFKDHAKDTISAQVRIDELKTELEKHTKTPIDLVDIEYAPLPLQYAIIQGQTLLQSNLTRLHHIENSILNRMELDYYDPHT